MNNFTCDSRKTWQTIKRRMIVDDSWFSRNYYELSYAWSNGENYHGHYTEFDQAQNEWELMIAGGQTEGRASTIDYHEPFDLGFELK